MPRLRPREPAGANRFCEECCTAPVRRCGGCGGEVPPTAKLCGTGGAEIREVVTIVFADLIGSTGLHERLDAESVRILMGRYCDQRRTGLSRLEGVEDYVAADSPRASQLLVGQLRDVREVNPLGSRTPLSLCDSPPAR